MGFCALHSPHHGADMDKDRLPGFKRALQRLGLLGETVSGQGVEGGQQQHRSAEEEMTGFHGWTGSFCVDEDGNCERANSGAKCASNSFATSRASLGAVVVRWTPRASSCRSASRTGA